MPESRPERATSSAPPYPSRRACLGRADSPSAPEQAATKPFLDRSSLPLRGPAVATPRRATSEHRYDQRRDKAPLGIRERLHLASTFERRAFQDSCARSRIQASTQWRGATVSLPQAPAVAAPARFQEDSTLENHREQTARQGSTYGRPASGRRPPEILRRSG